MSQKHRTHLLKGLRPALNAMAEMGFSKERCIQGSGIDITMFEDPKSSINYHDEFRIYRTMAELANIPSIGLHLGSVYKTVHFGMYGYALMSSTSLRQSIDIAALFSDLSYTMFQTSTGLSADQRPFLRLDMNYPIPNDLKRIFIDRDTATIKSVFTEITHNPEAITGVVLAYPPCPQTKIKDYENFFQCKVEFNGLTNLVYFNREIMDKRLPASDEMTINLCTKQCHNLLSSLRKAGRLADDVRHIILAKPGYFPNMEQTAKKLGMSTRTLRRKLNQESCSYQQLLIEIKLGLAREYMRIPIKLDEVSAMLGYSDPSNFSHAFKRVYGVSPSQWMQQKQLARGNS